MNFLKACLKHAFFHSLSLSHILCLSHSFILLSTNANSHTHTHSSTLADAHARSHTYIHTPTLTHSEAIVAKSREKNWAWTISFRWTMNRKKLHRTFSFVRNTGSDKKVKQAAKIFDHFWNVSVRTKTRTWRIFPGHRRWSTKSWKWRSKASLKKSLKTFSVAEILSFLKRLRVCRWNQNLNRKLEKVTTVLFRWPIVTQLINLFPKITGLEIIL